ncbi:hypothetical protein RHSIM_Rhsim13G0171700 [Rhododendron simsii]|uniref:F-box domain-containing protein n=1 Tax=Rhododendron simsii TaxID=118357 RepID=A0A834G023_RHOSS|nr:hypothetical protein RHSIM_Rhsim13G0171700 [Rhododendron simsii]
MSSRSNSPRFSLSENESADSGDHPLGEGSIEGSDSEASENSGSDRQVSEPSDNSDSDRRRGKRNRHASPVFDESSPKLRRRGGRIRKPAVDVISALPDALILHVLSFLPIEDAIKTQVLSKRWLRLWTYIPSLVFLRESDSSDTSVRDFVTFVDRTLVLCTCSKLKKLGFQFAYETDYASNVNLWTRFATGRGAEELQLDFYHYNMYNNMHEDDSYLLPQLLYTNSSFKTLKFSVCKVIPKGVVCWNSLKKLSIGYAELSEDVIEKILAGSPVLEILELYAFYGFDRLHVSNASVKKLILRDVWEHEEEYPTDGYHSVLEVSAPHLHSLEISGGLCDKICRLRDISSLVDANLNFDMTLYRDRANEHIMYENMLRGLLQSLVHVKKITLGTFAIQTDIPIIVALPIPIVVAVVRQQTVDSEHYRDAEELMIMSLSNRDRSIKNYPENAEIENVSSDSDCSCRSYRSPGYKPAKWPRTDRLKTTVDRLSELPDHVLVHMLSLLPIKEAIQTQVLSRRWKSPWTYLPSLHFHLLFNFHVSVRDIQRFVTFVDETLIRSNRSKLEKFEVLCWYQPNFASDVNRWTTFAVGKGTKELHLFLPLAGFDSGSNECYELPQYLYTNSSFGDLRFSWCSVTPEGVVAWNSPTRLSIGCVKLSEDVIHKILAGSPVLEILELYNFKGACKVTPAKFCGSKEVVPLHFRKITGLLARKSCWLGDASSLVDATLKFDLTQCDDDRSDDYERISSILQGLLVSLAHVQNITLGTWALQHAIARIQSNPTQPLLELADVGAVLLPNVVARWDEMLCEELIPTLDKFYNPFKDFSAMMVREEEEEVEIKDSIGEANPHTGEEVDDGNGVEDGGAGLRDTGEEVALRTAEQVCVGGWRSLHHQGRKSDMKIFLYGIVTLFVSHKASLCSLPKAVNLQIFSRGYIGLFCQHSSEFMDSNSALHLFGDPDSSMVAVFLCRWLRLEGLLLYSISLAIPGDIQFFLILVLFRLI